MPTLYCSVRHHVLPVVLDDDVMFIAEAAAGVVDAPDMAPAHELAKLRKKFDIWRREFKVRCGFEATCCLYCV